MSRLICFIRMPRLTNTKGIRVLTKITHFILFVSNQDEALNFYTNKLGFKIHTDAAFGAMRWLTLHLPGQPDVELALMLAETGEEKALIGKQGASKPLFTFETTDCKKDYETLSASGVEFTSEPESQPWGISASFKDLYGNALYMCQPSAGH